MKVLFPAILRGLVFLQLGAGQSVSAAGDVSYLGIAKTQYFSQSNAVSVFLAAQAGFGFRAFVVLNPEGHLLGVFLQEPPDLNRVEILSNGDSLFFLDKRFDTKSQLDGAYPAGGYRFLTHSFAHAVKTLSLLLPKDAYPDPARLANYEAAQTIEASADFTLAWDAFVDGTSDDFVKVEIADAEGNLVFATSDIDTPTALTGKSTAVTIPAGALATKRSYSASLLFAKFTRLNRDSYPNALGVTGFFSQTSFTLQTFPRVIVPPRIGFNLTPGGQFQVKFESVPGMAYSLDVSSNLVNWLPLLTTNATVSSLTFIDPETPHSNARFYRVRMSLAEHLGR